MTLSKNISQTKSHRIKNSTGSYLVNLFLHNEPNQGSMEIYSITESGEFDQEYYEYLTMELSGSTVTSFAGTYRMPEECGQVLLLEGFTTVEGL